MFKINNKNLKIPKAVIFDTDNTILDSITSDKFALKKVQKRAAKKLNISEKKFQNAFFKSRKEIKELLGYSASSHSRLLYFQRTIEHLGFGSSIFLSLDFEQTYWREFLLNSELYENIEDLLGFLKSKKIKTANITDLTAQIQFRKMVYFGLDNYFDFVVTSEESGEDKPSKKTFDLVLKKLSFDPEEIWMIGDDYEKDIKGAKNVGIKTLHYTNSYNMRHISADIQFNDYKKLFDFMLSL